MIFSKSRIAIAMAASMGLGLSSGASLAQESSNETAADENVEKISITGSRLRRAEFSQASPVFSFGSEDISVRGFTNVASILNQSPLFGGSQTPVGAQDAADAGQNQVNLFDLGTVRTLTLVNGRRFVSGQSPTLGGSQVDLNSIPAALIERIEVVPLTGAASYGADAIAGTVNIILKDDYEGFQAWVQGGNNEEGNYKQINFGVVGGGNFAEDRGNVTFGMEYTKDDGLLRCDFDELCINNPFQDDPRNRYLDLDGDGVPDDRNGDGVLDANDAQSSTAIRRGQRIRLFGETGSIGPLGGAWIAGAAGAASDGNFYGWTPGGDLDTCQPGPAADRGIFAYTPDGESESDICGSDFFDSVAQIISPVSRFNTYASLSYDITDEITYKTDFVFSNSKARELVNQGGFQTHFFGGTGAPLDFDLSNPFLSAQTVDQLTGLGFEDGFSLYRFNNDIVSLGANANENSTWRVSNILEGVFTLADKDFWWDISVVHGRNDSVVETVGIVDGRFLNAVDARRIDDALLEQVRLQDPEDATDDLESLDAALLALQNSRSQFTGGFQRGDIICGAYADLAAGTLGGFNSRASGNGLTDEDLPFIDGCVPLNLFGDAAQLNSPEALDFIQGGPRFARSENKQTVFTANIGGSAFELPAGFVDFVVGYERRIEKGTYRPGLGLRVPVTRSSLDQSVLGGFDTNEYYFELAVPLIDESMDIPLVQGLDLTLAYRNQEFNTDAPRGFEDRSTDEDVYQVSLMWDLNDEVAVRGTYATAFRNPSIQELFQPEVQTFINGDDPCDARSVGLGPNPSVRRANCESIGIDPDTFTSNIQDGTISTGFESGNQDLQPETNESYSVGIVYSPKAVDGLDIAIDYYNLEIEDSIEQLEFEDQAAICFDSNNFPNEPACNSFIRDDDFQVIRVTELPINVATSTFESVTFKVLYEHDLGEWGTLKLDSFNQYNITNEFQATPGSEVEEDVGDFADPDYLGTFDIDWYYDDWLVSWRTRWQSSVAIDALEQQVYADSFDNSTTGFLDNGDEVTLWTGNWDNSTGTRFITDLSASYTFSSNTTVQLNVFNLFDRDPGANGVKAWGVRHFGLDEQIGRRFSLRVTQTF
ncbi:TonB-dependent receptor domain-containing protein [Agaribacter flavus]|uniref:TonB-dependent receptor domain-containing protein n=1 Tax=Agaribacter flavus TaxID=1902781 RepID=A0ABV7FN89_9ALTE